VVTGVNCLFLVSFFWLRSLDSAETLLLYCVVPCQSQVWYWTIAPPHHRRTTREYSSTTSSVSSETQNGCISASL